MLSHYTPHAYGDKRRTEQTYVKRYGSSPRVWGQAESVCLAYAPRRIIPTRMGTSSVLERRNFCWVDHPHAYGDKLLNNVRYGNFRGSSPRVWGQEQKVGQSGRVHRIIPTRMGTRLASLCDTMLSGDHPHAYGDKSWSFAPADSVAGSSPRVWGQVDGKSKATFEKRIIPTRMGTRNPLRFKACYG